METYVPALYAKINAMINPTRAHHNKISAEQIGLEISVTF